MLDEIALVAVMRNVSDITQDRSINDKPDQQRDAKALEAFADK